MPDSTVEAFTEEGNVNPEWTQFINNKDALTSEIAAYFLSGEGLREEVKCFVTECVMGARGCCYINPDTKMLEFNPMMLCFYCDRTFHAGCVDLDEHLIRDESVPWRCVDCKKDFLNQFCQSYYKKTRYQLKLIDRRAKFLKADRLPEDSKSLKKDIVFSNADLKSFERRAVMILRELDADAIKDPVNITPLLLKNVMKARADKKASKDTAERFRFEMEKRDKQIEELMRRLNKLDAEKEAEKIASHSLNADESILQHTTNGSISFADAAHSSMMPSSRASNVLTSFYTASDNPASVEKPRENRTLNANASHSNNSASQVTINEADLSSLLSRITIVQEKNEDRRLLETARKAMPKMTEFNGDDSKWLTFKEDVERYRTEGEYDDKTLKYYMRGALKGEALAIVRDLLNTASVNDIMATLKCSFGDETKMVRNRTEDLRNFKFNTVLCKREAVKLQALIQAYFAACNYAKVGYVNTNIIAEGILNQFDTFDRQKVKEFYVMRNPTCSTILIDVQTIYDYLMSRMPFLDDGPVRKKSPESDNKPKSKAFQVQSINVSSNAYDGFKYELKDKLKAPYIGYSLEKVAAIPKDCKMCQSSEHFTLQCPKYKELNENERMRHILAKRICKSCVLTTEHRAVNCDVKSGCGFKIDKSSRCSQKHHISIHHADISEPQSNRSKIQKKRFPNTRNNTARAVHKVDEIKKEEAKAVSNVAFHALNPVDLSKNYAINAVGSASSGDQQTKSIKMFRIKFWGPKGHVIALAVGDSGSEVTLMRDDLREALGIAGKNQPLQIQFADKTNRVLQAMQFNMKIQGMDSNAVKYDINNCFAVKELNLPSRSLNMGKLREQFPHLKNIPFEGYENEEPVMLIGSPHAHLIEGCELVENGESNPIAVRTKLGWSVYGGSKIINESTASVKAVNEVTAEDDEEMIESKDEKVISNEELHELLVQHFSIESLGIRSELTRQTEDEKKAIELLETEMITRDDGFIEVPLLWNKKEGKIPELPNNYPLTLQRQYAQERKLAKNPERMNAFNNNVKELLTLGFLREADESDMKGNWPNVWYLPTSLVVNENKNPPKMRNVYDASCVYKGESLNHNLLKGPDYLVNILQPLFKMRMSKIAFTADVKSMFNMIKICKRDQQCQRILWRENLETSMKTYVATVMLFGPTCSPVTSQYVKNKTAESFAHEYPPASKTLIEFTYMNCLNYCRSVLNKNPMPLLDGRFYQASKECLIKGSRQTCLPTWQTVS